MKNTIVKFLSRYSYPHYLFLKSINKNIGSNINTVIIDCPCGNGEITYVMAKNFHTKVFGYDISAKAIQIASERYQLPNLKFETRNIFDVFQFHDKINIFCIVNSLFLLPEPGKLLNKVSRSLTLQGKALVIIPNIESVNFKEFQKNSSTDNLLILNKQQAFDLFISCGFDVKYVEGLAYANMYGRKELKYFSLLWTVYLLLLHYLFKLFRKGLPSYWFFVLEKKDVSENKKEHIVHF